MKIAWNRITAFDRSVVLASHRIRNLLLTWVMRVFTYSASTPAWVAIGVCLYLIHRISEDTIVDGSLLLSLIPAVVASIIGNSLRPLLKRPRPFVTIPQHDAIVWVPKNYSMPSSHAASTVAWFFALYLFGHPLTVVVGVWAFFVTLSRLYLGVHYPSDLIAGVVLGVLTATGFHLFI